MAPPRPQCRGLDEKAGGVGVPAALWRTSQGVQKPLQACWGKRFLTGSEEQVLLAPPAGPGSGPSRWGGVAALAAPGWMVVPPLWEVKVQQVPPLWEVKVLQVPPLWEVKVQQRSQDAHLTRPRVGVEGAANRVAPPLLQHVAVLGVYRDGQQDTGEVTPTVQLTLAVGRVGAAALGPRQGCGRA